MKMKIIDSLVIGFFWVFAMVGVQKSYVYLSKKQSFWQLGYSQAETVKSLSSQWLKEARMEDRIEVLGVKLQKNQDSLQSVQVKLGIKEDYSKEYQAQLLQYLQKRAVQETGVPYQFVL